MEHRFDLVLDLAFQLYRERDLSRALACSKLAADLKPRAVEAQHLRAAVLTGLGRYSEAQIAFAAALALDPNDPETLADAADFHINMLEPKSRESVQVGLLYAQRGARRAEANFREQPELIARLHLLIGEALSDLGMSESALFHVEEALRLSPDIAGLKREYASVLFHSLQFEESEALFRQVVLADATDAYAHFHLGLIYERQKKFRTAGAHFERAAQLQPKEFPRSYAIDDQGFTELVAEAQKELPAELKSLLKEAEVVVEDLPTYEDLAAASPPFSPTILGLFRGLPAGIPSEDTKRIFLYRNNIRRNAPNKAMLKRLIASTLRHEIGHLQGYDEDELRRMGME